MKVYVYNYNFSNNAYLNSFDIPNYKQYKRINDKLKEYIEQQKGDKNVQNNKRIRI